MNNPPPFQLFLDTNSSKSMQADQDEEKKLSFILERSKKVHRNIGDWKLDWLKWLSCLHISHTKFNKKKKIALYAKLNTPRICVMCDTMFA